MILHSSYLNYKTSYVINYTCMIACEPTFDQVTNGFMLRVHFQNQIENILKLNKPNSLIDIPSSAQ